ncbi:MAG: hypothetical protein QOH03_5171, partial [Kribbellaceae bacterium]|nr:hypothetical protein [Kribbellaceae bacterium]
MVLVVILPLKPIPPHNSLKPLSHPIRVLALPEVRDHRLTHAANGTTTPCNRSTTDLQFMSSFSGQIRLGGVIG